MISVIQRVLSASVTVDGEKVANSGEGLLLLLGVSSEDNEEDARLLADKISKLRVFCDDNDKMNKSVYDIGGTVTVVPNFTLMASYKKGNRPDYMRGAKPERANELFEYFYTYILDLVPHVQKGIFKADMKVELINDGPVTIVMDSRVLRGEREV
ncbi:MAG: D-tyrosyl-tRNA(Tyr) deacylase [Clostridia bacterium]|nr:D-tyrosyl-tRNA(Tyr) deacylase [Clostridia bacterium]